MTTSAFLDTNVWVHYRPIDEIDWLALLGADEAELLVPAIVIDELDKLKDQASSRRVRDRARSALKRIEDIAAGPPVIVRPRVTCRVVHDLAGDPASHSLLATRADDVLIATILAYRGLEAQTRIVLVSADTGPRLKARRFSIEALEPPEVDKITEPDPHETENRVLQREIQRLTHRRPALAVRLVGGSSEGAFLELPPLQSPSQTQQVAVAAALADAERLAPIYERPVQEAPPVSLRAPKGAIDLSQVLGPPGGISVQEYDRYDRERVEYLKSVKEWARQEWLRSEESSRSIKIVLELVNEGTSVAEDVDVILDIPDGPEVREWEEPEPLERPQPPRAPRTGIDYLRHGFMGVIPTSYHLPDYGAFLRAPGPALNVSAPAIRRVNSYEVQYHVSRLKHNTTESLGDLLFVYSSPDEARGLGIGWRIICATLPEVVQGKIHLAIRR